MKISNTPNPMLTNGLNSNQAIPRKSVPNENIIDTATRQERKDMYVPKSPVEVAGSDSAIYNQNAQFTNNFYQGKELIMRLEQAEGNNVPVYFSLDEMNTFLEQAPVDIIEAMSKHIEKFAEPAPMPIVDMKTDPKQNQQRSDTYLSYDFSTRTEQVLPFDNSDPNTTVQESEGRDVNDAAKTMSGLCFMLINTLNIKNKLDMYYYSACLTCF